MSVGPSTAARFSVSVSVRCSLCCTCLVSVCTASLLANPATSSTLEAPLASGSGAKGLGSGGPLTMYEPERRFPASASHHAGWWPGNDPPQPPCCRPPASARARARADAPIRPGERLLAVACGAGGQLLAATDRALYHQAGQAWARLRWEQVGRVGWDEQRHILMLTGLPPAVPARAARGLDGLKDLPRPGRPRRISALERAAVCALACQLPAATGVPLSRWTAPELAAELRAQGLASPISPSS